MPTIVIAEIVSAVFLGIILLKGVTEYEPSKSNRRLTYSLLLMLCALAVDVMAYVFVGPAYPVAIRYVINMLSFMAGSIVMLGFIFYCEAIVKEKTEPNPWCFRIAKLLNISWLVVTVCEFVVGHFIAYENGVESVNYYVPVYLQLIVIVLLFYLPAVVFMNRRIIGNDAVFLLCLFNLAPIIGIFASHVTKYDYSYVFSAVSLVLIVEFIHRKKTQNQKDIVYRATQIIATLSEDFTCVDYVEFHDNKLNDKATQFRVSDILKKAIPEWENEVVFTRRLDLLKEKFVYEPDRKRFYEETRRERIMAILEGSVAAFVNFRIFEENVIQFYQLKISAVRSNGRLTGFVIGLHSIDEQTRKEMEVQQRLQDALDKAEEEAIRRKMVYEISDSSQWSYEIGADDKINSAQYTDSLKEIVKAEFSGKTMGWVELLHPDDKERVSAAFVAAVSDHTGNTHYNETFRILGKDGKYSWIKSVGRVIRHADGTGEFIGMAMDFTAQFEEQRRQQEQLEKALAEATLANQRNDALHEAIKSGPWSFVIEEDNKTVHAHFSDELRRIIHYELRPDPYSWTEQVHPDDRERARKAFLDALFDTTCKTPYDDVYRFRGDDGVYRWFHSAGRKIRLADGRSEIFGLFMDITERMETDRKHQEQLADALSMAETANKAKTDFLFNMSHDIRTPMNAIIGFTGMAKKEIGNPEKALDCLEKVQLSSEILLNLINDVLDMSRIESGKVELHEDKYEITEAFDSFEPAMANLAASKDIDLKFIMGTIRDRYIFADGPRFDRVLINIISNAIKYTLPNGFVKVSVDQIEDSRPGYGNYRFTVADSGIGMSEEFQKHMFEDFTREENTTTSGIQGTGLGLSLAKKLVDMMGGTISCVSAQGIGTTFTIVFPFRLQTEKDMAEKNIAPRDSTVIDLNGKKALLVEDNELNREIGCEVLSDKGIAVETAENGQTAVNKVREMGADYYDFILMDIQMPVMNGYEATKAIRKLMPELKAPIIALSANAFAEDRKKSIDAGMDDHVAKPINVKELVGVLSKFLIGKKTTLEAKNTVH